MDYEEMLEKGVKELPDSLKKTERFEIPKVRGHIEGNKTVISNFKQIADALGRDPDKLLKYILKEIAAKGEFKGNLLVIGRKVGSKMINEKIEKFAKEFVICPECKKPDTKIVKEEKVTFLRCLACGARHPVKGNI